MKNLIGERIGKLVVIGFEYKQDILFWKCKCDCGNVKYVKTNNIRRIKSCGCLQKEILYKRCCKHGDGNTRLYRIWKNLRYRINNKKSKDYKYYGGRNIKICNEWNDFLEFKNWAINNGYDDKLTIDRIDTNGNYCPQNCRWVDMYTQTRNRRSNVLISLKNGNKICLKDYCKNKGLDSNYVSRKVHKMGMAVQEVLLSLENNIN